MVQQRLQMSTVYSTKIIIDQNRHFDTNTHKKERKIANNSKL